MSTIADAGTTWLALSADAATGAARRDDTPAVTHASVHPTSDDRMQQAYNAMHHQHLALSGLLHAPAPRHVVGQQVPNLCAAPAADPRPMGAVVAHYDENLDWLGSHSQDATIYCKNDHFAADVYGNHRAWVDLPNIGLETHTYLFHILSHWDCLDDVTLFAQGRVDDSIDNYQGIDELFSRTQNNPEGLILYRNGGMFNEWWGVWHFGKWKEELDAGIIRRADRNPGDFWRYLFKEEPPEAVHWTWSATFAVRRERIRMRPHWFYQRAFEYFERLNHTKPEEGHFMERFWESVYNPSLGPRVHTRQRRAIHYGAHTP